MLLTAERAGYRPVSGGCPADVTVLGETNRTSRALITDHANVVRSGITPTTMCVYRSPRASPTCQWAARRGGMIAQDVGVGSIWLLASRVDAPRRV